MIEMTLASWSRHYVVKGIGVSVTTANSILHRLNSMQNNAKKVIIWNFNNILYHGDTDKILKVYQASIDMWASICCIYELQVQGPYYKNGAKFGKIQMQFKYEKHSELSLR